MYRRILIGYDPERNGDDAVVLASALGAATGASLVLGYVFAFGRVEAQFGGRAWEKAVGAEAATRFARPLAALPREVQAETRVVGSSSVARGLYDLAEAEEADLIVVGSSHRSRLGRVIAGSVAQLLLQGAPRAVAVAPRGLREREGWEVRRIGIGFDDSIESRVALRVAVDLARAAGAEIEIVSVEVGLRPGLHSYRVLYEELAGVDRTQLRAAARSALEGARSGGVEASLKLRSGDATDELAAASEALDVVVLGSRGYGPIRSSLLGGVSSRLVQVAGCAVLVVPRPD